MKFAAGLLAASLTAVAISGCSRPLPAPSAFFSSINLKAVVDQCAPQEMHWGGRGFGEGGGGSTANPQNDKLFDGNFRCDPEVVDLFLQALKAELRKRVEENGGHVTESVIPGTESATRGFQLRYQAGKMRGSIRAMVTKNETGSIASDKGRFPLELRIDVEEPADAREGLDETPKTDSGG